MTMIEAVIQLGVMVYWSIGMIFIFALRDDVEPKKMAAVAAFWPLFAVLSLPMMLWRTVFRSAQSMRMDLRSRKLLNEFDRWLKAKGDTPTK